MRVREKDDELTNARSKPKELPPKRKKKLPGFKLGQELKNIGFKKGESGIYDANGFPYIAEKEHPNAPLGTVKGHKTTKKQQALFGIARGMQKGETPQGYSSAGAKLAGGLSGKEVHKIASKPKSGYRKSPGKSESVRMREAEERLMQMVYEEEARAGSRPFAGAAPPFKKKRERPNWPKEVRVKDVDYPEEEDEDEEESEEE
jgi:hypothetical protein